MFQKESKYLTFSQINILKELSRQNFLFFYMMLKTNSGYSGSFVLKLDNWVRLVIHSIVKKVLMP